uniref:Uncharacterized protein n=1 Tax=Anguilla anguilla TaxID=7936 RepID=A0A0E9SSM4_ANGAN
MLVKQSPHRTEKPSTTHSIRSRETQYHTLMKSGLFNTDPLMRKQMLRHSIGKCLK